MCSSPAAGMLRASRPRAVARVATSAARRELGSLPEGWSKSVWTEGPAAASLAWEENLTWIERLVSPQEQDCLLQDVQRPLRRRRYQASHWDGVIDQYREIGLALPRWSEESRGIIEEKVLPRLPQVARPLLDPHVLDLDGDGAIYPHVDNVDFSGEFVAGLSLLSTAVMRLTPADGTREGAIWLKLAPGSFYVLRGQLRYAWKHEILGRAESIFMGKPVPRERRVSLLFRDANDADPPF